jgi:hypothetical protein
VGRMTTNKKEQERTERAELRKGESKREKVERREEKTERRRMRFEGDRRRKAGGYENGTIIVLPRKQREKKKQFYCVYLSSAEMG